MQYSSLPENVQTWQLQPSGRWPGHHIWVMWHQTSNRKNIEKNFLEIEWINQRGYICSFFQPHLLLRRLKSSLTASYFLSKVPYMMLMDSLGPPSALRSSWCWRRSSDISLRSSSRNLENFPMKYFGTPSEKESHRLRLRVSWSSRWFSMTTSLYRVRRFSASWKSKNYNIKVFLETNIYLSIVVHILESLV